jgi:hypothetical protein
MRFPLAGGEGVAVLQSGSDEENCPERHAACGAFFLRAGWGVFWGVFLTA